MNPSIDPMKCPIGNPPQLAAWRGEILIGRRMQISDHWSHSWARGGEEEEKEEEVDEAIDPLHFDGDRTLDESKQIIHRRKNVVLGGRWWSAVELLLLLLQLISENELGIASTPPLSSPVVDNNRFVMRNCWKESLLWIVNQCRSSSSRRVGFRMITGEWLIDEIGRGVYVRRSVECEWYRNGDPFKFDQNCWKEWSQLVDWRLQWAGRKASIMLLLWTYKRSPERN